MFKLIEYEDLDKTKSQALYLCTYGDGRNYTYVYSAAQHATRLSSLYKDRTNAMYRRNVSGSVAFVDLGSFLLRLNPSLALTILQAAWVCAV
jgi:hypothetical protein